MNYSTFTPRIVISSQRSLMLLTIAYAAIFVFVASAAQAQFGPPDPGTRVKDAESLKPPAGAKVAIIEFVDLQCPDCARANSMLKQAVAQYHIQWVRHDFPLPFHSWSRNAAVNARWFDRTSMETGNEYRNEVFVNQPTIKSSDDLRLFTEKFARDHGITLPVEVDPDGKLLALVKADYALGQKIGVEHTPTIWVVSSKGMGAAPFVEVLDYDRLSTMIEQAMKDEPQK